MSGALASPFPSWLTRFEKYSTSIIATTCSPSLTGGRAAGRRFVGHAGGPPELHREARPAEGPPGCERQAGCPKGFGCVLVALVKQVGGALGRVKPHPVDDQDGSAGPDVRKPGSAQ